MTTHAIYGSGGFARELMPLLRSGAWKGTGDLEWVFVEDSETLQESSINGASCRSFDFLKDHSDSVKV